MRILFYTPFVPLNHPRDSGDKAIAHSIVEFLKSRGMRVTTPSHFSSEWIWRRPWMWGSLWAARRAMRRALVAEQPDAVLVYHSYYRAPDCLSPVAARRGVPVFHVGSAYASRRARSWRTRPGHQLNLKALRYAAHCFTMKTPEYENLRRILPPEHVTKLGLGVETTRFVPAASPESLTARAALRRSWGVPEHAPVVLTVATLRPGAKSEGVAYTIEALARLAAQRPEREFRYVVAGGGPALASLRDMAETHLPGRALFLNAVPAREISAIYAAADCYAFPGIREGLGLAYLEAQCSGLPAVGWDAWGAAECIRRDVTGFLTPAWDVPTYAAAVAALLDDPAQRLRLGEAAREHILRNHDRDRNYAVIEETMERVTREIRTRPTKGAPPAPPPLPEGDL